MSVRRSIQPTYDSRVTGPAYHVTYRINGKTITFREPIADPFVNGRITIGWLDLLRGLFRGRLTVEVMVGGDVGRMNDVLELDANALVRNSSRRAAFDGRIQEALEKL